MFTPIVYTGGVEAPWVSDVAQSPWAAFAMLALVVLDAFLVVVPGETAVVALAAASAPSGFATIAGITGLAWLGAMIGDGACFALGRTAGLERWRWQRRPAVRRVVNRVRGVIHRRPASLIFTARYVPFARIAVNMTAGASGLPVRIFAPLSALAGLA